MTGVSFSLEVDKGLALDKGRRTLQMESTVGTQAWSQKSAWYIASRRWGGGMWGEAGMGRTIKSPG